MIKLAGLVEELKISDDMRIHMSKKPFELERRVYSQRIDAKPTGFWYGLGNEWIDWTRYEMPNWIGKYIYKVDIDKSNILEIKTHRDLMVFNRQYQSLKSVTGYRREKGEAIDWDVISKKYDGIEINPYQQEARYQYMWYYGWDIASGCIWNLNKVKLTLLTDNGIE